MTFVIDRTCIRCHGDGMETFWDGEWEGHVCYHCGGIGRVDEDMAFHDSLQRVAYTLAYNEVSSLRNARNENPDEDWDFCAAENMMSSWDYFREEVYQRVPAYLDRLIALSRESQEVLIAWNDLPASPAPRVINNPASADSDSNTWECPQESDIPF